MVHWAVEASLEKGIALEDLQTEVEAGGLVNLYWIGKRTTPPSGTTVMCLPTWTRLPAFGLPRGGGLVFLVGKRCYEYQRASPKLREDGHHLRIKAQVVVRCLTSCRAFLDLAIASTVHR